MKSFVDMAVRWGGPVFCVAALANLPVLISGVLRHLYPFGDWHTTLSADLDKARAERQPHEHIFWESDLRCYVMFLMMAFEI